MRFLDHLGITQQQTRKGAILLECAAGFYSKYSASSTRRNKCIAGRWEGPIPFCESTVLDQYNREFQKRIRLIDYLSTSDYYSFKDNFVAFLPTSNMALGDIQQVRITEKFNSSVHLASS